MEKLLLAVWDSAVTCTVKSNLPDKKGVPLITPLFDNVNPPGSVPRIMDHVYGGVPPDAVSCAE